MKHKSGTNASIFCSEWYWAQFWHDPVWWLKCADLHIYLMPWSSFTSFWRPSLRSKSMNLACLIYSIACHCLWLQVTMPLRTPMRQHVLDFPSWWPASFQCQETRRRRNRSICVQRPSFIPYILSEQQYCTIPTKCSADVTRDTVEHLRQVFEINKGVWHGNKSVRRQVRQLQLPRTKLDCDSLSARSNVTPKTPSTR